MQAKKTRYKKRAGSSLVVVLMIFTVLFVLSASVMGTLSMAVKVQSAEKNNVETLYEAESGIASVQAALEKTFETAMNIAQSKATSNENFQTAVETFIGTANDNKFTQSAQTLSYWHNETEQIQLSQLDNEITVHNSVYNEAEKRWEMVVQSAFTDTTQTKRTVQVNVKIQLPEWSPAPEIEEEENPDLEAPLLPLLTRNSLTIDGNLYVKNKSVNVKDGIFVQGRPDPELSGLDAKYSGGIYNQQPDGGVFEMPNAANVATGQTVHLNGNTATKMSSATFYAKNILIEDQANFDARTAILDSDLVITASKGQTNLDQFYGINDVMVDKPSLVRDSSSIIINAPVTTLAQLKITTKAIIAGTAWIDLATPYQTGESLAIQGNYLAYTIPASELQSVCSDTTSTTSIGKCSDLVYEYYEPLQVITGVKNLNTVQEWTVADKAKYFKIIAEKLNQNQQYIKFNQNFSLPRCWEGNECSDAVAAGALLYQDYAGNVIVNLPDASASEKITTMQKEKQPEYARQVYRLGFDNVGTNEELQAIYNQYGADTWGIENILDFSKGEPIQVANSEYWDDQANDSLIYNPDPEKTVYVVELKKTCPEVDASGKQVICMQLNHWKERLILTAGDVVFQNNSQSSYTFSGAVLADGDVTIEGNAPIQIQLPANPETVFTNILTKFGGDKLSGVFLPVPGSQTVMTLANEDGFGYYSPKEFVLLERWKLIK